MVLPPAGLSSFYLRGVAYAATTTIKRAGLYSSQDMHDTFQAAIVAWVPISIYKVSQKRRKMEIQKLKVGRASRHAGGRTRTTACYGRHFTRATAAR